jgi:hypothetical protein
MVSPLERHLWRPEYFCDDVLQYMRFYTTVCYCKGEAVIMLS